MFADHEPDRPRLRRSTRRWDSAARLLGTDERRRPAVDLAGRPADSARFGRTRVRKKIIADQLLQLSKCRRCA
jgi:hypothetical protein